MKLKFAELTAVTQALQELWKLEIPASSALKILSIIDQVEGEYKKINSVLNKIQLEFVPKDEDGNPMIQENGSFVPTDIEKYEQKIKEFMELEHELQFKDFCSFDDLQLGTQSIKLETLRNIKNFLALIEKDNQSTTDTPNHN